MLLTAAVVACVLLAALAVFQVALIAGAPLGHYAWGGQHAVLPRRLRIGSAVSVVLYAVFALMIVGAAGMHANPGNEGVVDLGSWILTAYFTVGIAMNLASRSRPERLVMTPVCVVLAACCLVIALQ